MFIIIIITEVGRKWTGREQKWNNNLGGNTTATVYTQLGGGSWEKIRMHLTVVPCIRETCSFSEDSSVCLSVCLSVRQFL
jgi:hypothetical protein